MHFMKYKLYRETLQYSYIKLTDFFITIGILGGKSFLNIVSLLN